MSKHAERDVILGHEDEADGIQEYDNPLPDWWVGLFWLTILFAIGYAVHYHFIADRSYPKALAQELADAEARWPTPGAASGGEAEFAVTAEAASAGATVYQQNCASCHGANLTGGIGPSLVDAEWIHGGTPEAIRNTITNGVIERGMLAWGPILGAERITQVTAYVVQQNADALGLPFPPEHDEEGEADHDEGGDARS